MPDSDGNFALAPALLKDCHRLGRLHGNQLLLMDTSLVPWFILVPETRVTELCDLPEAERRHLDQAMGQLSDFIRRRWTVDKLNVAAIGNVVSQLHLHVIGRHRQDYCWPGVVWGRPEKAPYGPERVAEISAWLQAAWADEYQPGQRKE